MLTLASVRVLKVSRKVSKAGKDFNIVTILLPNYDKLDLFVSDEYLPDDFEGKIFQVKIEIGVRNWKPDIKIVGKFIPE